MSCSKRLEQQSKWKCQIPPLLGSVFWWKSFLINEGSIAICGTGTMKSKNQENPNFFNFLSLQPINWVHHTVHTFHPWKEKLLSIFNISFPNQWFYYHFFLACIFHRLQGGILLTMVREKSQMCEEKLGNIHIEGEFLTRGLTGTLSMIWRDIWNILRKFRLTKFV